MYMLNIQSTLCKSIRGCGIRKAECLELVNHIMKWYNSSGSEFTVSRIKGLHRWYEEYRAGALVKPPEWYRHGRDNLPLGIWKRLFLMKNSKRVFAVLSTSTIFTLEKVSKNQREKFLKGLATEHSHPSIPTDFLFEGPFKDCRAEREGYRHAKVPLKKGGYLLRVPSLGVTTPTILDITGNSIPLDREDGKLRIKSSSNKMDKMKALGLSWEHVPVPTLQLLRDVHHLEQVPPGALDDASEDLFAVFPANREYAGHIGFIQEPGDKLRTVANPNKITQHYLRPLGRELYSLCKELPSDCTFEQFRGAEWCQQQLNLGKRLACCDLTSASDKLDKYACADLIFQYFYGIGRLRSNPPQWEIMRYHIKHWMSISEMKWYTDPKVIGKGIDFVQWKSGQPLGTHPSFACLALSNSLIARLAEKDSIPDAVPFSSFRVIGDDIVMDHRMVNSYISTIEQYGGEINHSKTLISDRLVEFGGMVITPSMIHPKTLKFKQVSDDSFMLMMSSLGQQAKSLLRPRQRKQFEEFQYVPGYLVEGPWMQDSVKGQPLDVRYQWYLEQIQADLKPEPDQELVDPVADAMEYYYALQDTSRFTEKRHQVHLGDLEYQIPYETLESIQDSFFHRAFLSGDPRKVNGKTWLEHLESISSQESYQSYLDYAHSMYKEIISRKSSSIRELKNDLKTPDSDLYRLIQALIQAGFTLEGLYHEANQIVNGQDKNTGKRNQGPSTSPSAVKTDDGPVME